jgi:uncharacterized membrane protein
MDLMQITEKERLTYEEAAGRLHGLADAFARHAGSGTFHPVWMMWPARGRPTVSRHRRSKGAGMSDKPVFLYAAIYDAIPDAEADYEAVFDLHAAGAIGTFDSAVIRKEQDGKVRVTKTEKPTQHGAWTGAGVGALVGLVFPPAIIGSAIVGAGAGGLAGHLSRGMSRGDLKELGDELDAGTAAVVVLGESKLDEQLEKALARSNKLIEKQVDADADELKREIDAAAQPA